MYSTNFTAGLGLKVALDSYGYAHVSHGTLHPADLMEAMYSAIMAYAEPSADLTAWSEDVLNTVWKGAWGDHSHYFWDTEVARYMLEEMEQILDNLAPEGYYFGASEGDASDFAIWPIAEEEAV